MSHEWLMLAGATALAATAQGAAGFGFAILAVPLYLLILDSVVAVQVAIVVTPVISIAVVPRLWHAVARGLLLRLALGSLLGFPLGLALYLHADVARLTAGAGLLISGFAVFLLLAARGRVADGDRQAPGTAWGDVVAGFVSGVLASSLAMPGPPLLIHFTLRRLPKDTARATMLSLFVLSYLGSLALQAGIAGMARGTWLTAAAIVPVAALGALAGNALARRMGEGAFRRLAVLLLLVTGVYALGSALLR